MAICDIEKQRKKRTMKMDDRGDRISGLTFEGWRSDPRGWKKPRRARRLGWLVVLMILMALTLTVAGAMADGPINPLRENVLRAERGLNVVEPTDSLTGRGSGSPVALKCVTAPALGGKGTWTITTNSSYGSVRSMTISIMMKDSTSDYTTMYYKESIRSSFTSPVILSGGEYKLNVWVSYSSNSPGYGYAESYAFPIADDAAHTSLTEKISQVVAECRASTRWQTALNLHDWLTHHAYYDNALEFYGAEGVLLRGKGVCDSYSKAYLMLCRAAGITASKVEGSAGGLHAWNAIQLDGKWYYVDPTWDDPAGAEKAVSGYERHEYYCLNEELMSLDHTNDRKLFNQSCTSLDANYVIHTGAWRDWGKDYGYNYDSGTFYVITFLDQMKADLEEGRTSLSSSATWIWYPAENGDYNISSMGSSKRTWVILAYGMNGTSLSLSDGSEVILSAAGNADGVVISLAGWKLNYAGILKLPAGTKELKASAFEGVRAARAEIPARCERIGMRAFANSWVRTVVIPSGVQEIANDAFEGCGRLIMITDNPVAIQMAEGRGDFVVSP